MKTERKREMEGGTSKDELFERDDEPTAAVPLLPP